MSKKNTVASSPSEDELSIAKKSRFVEYTKNATQRGLYGILLAGTLGAAALGSVAILKSEQIHRDIVEPTISKACPPTSPQPIGNRLVGLPAELAAGMVLLRPKEIREICLVINAARDSKYDMNNFEGRSTGIYVLSNVLDVTAHVARIAIKQEKSRQAMEAGKSSVQQLETNSDLARGPNI